jgi:hypothetical protein
MKAANKLVVAFLVEALCKIPFVTANCDTNGLVFMENYNPSIAPSSKHFSKSTHYQKINTFFKVYQLMFIQWS